LEIRAARSADLAVAKEETRSLADSLSREYPDLKTAGDVRNADEQATEAKKNANSRSILRLPQVGPVYMFGEFVSTMVKCSFEVLLTKIMKWA
jgi:hypothetical protein